MPPLEHHFIPPHGGYKELLSYQKAVTIYAGTSFSAKKWMPKYGDRSMDQAARSGKQNIVEGSVAAGTFKETEVKLTNAARASNEEP